MFFLKIFQKYFNIIIFAHTYCLFFIILFSDIKINFFQQKDDSDFKLIFKNDNFLDNKNFIYFHCNSLICDFYLKNQTNENIIFKNNLKIENNSQEKIRILKDQIIKFKYDENNEIFCNILTGMELQNMIASVGILQHSNDIINDIILNSTLISNNNNKYEIYDLNNIHTYDVINNNYLVLPYLEQKKNKYLEIYEYIKYKNKNKIKIDEFKFNLNPLFSKNEICDNMLVKDDSKLINDNIYKEETNTTIHYFDFCGGYYIKFNNIMIEKNISFLYILNFVFENFSAIFLDLSIIISIIIIKYFSDFIQLKKNKIK